MFQPWQRRRAVRRVEPGDGRELQRFRWWQFLGRALFHLEHRGTRGETRRVQPLLELPLWLNITLAVAAAIAITERALRLRCHWFLDAAGN